MSGMIIQPAKEPLNADVQIPGSKSLTNRALAVAALADGASDLTGVLFADDSQHMLDCLRSLEFGLEVDEVNCRVRVTGGHGRIPAPDSRLYCGASGTTMRFCTAMVALGMGNYELSGTQRMHERPIGALVDAVRRLGGLVEYTGREGFPPLVVHGRGLAGGTISLTSPPSSQLVSAVLMVAPCARADVFLEVLGPLVSRPYVDMTIALMEAFGVEVVAAEDGQAIRFIVAAPQRYQPQQYAIEPDASNASYFLAAAAVAGGRVTVRGLGTASVQGDARFVDVLERMGCEVERAPDALTVCGPPDGRQLRGIDVDLNDMPDMVQTLAVTALFADGPTRVSNVANLRLKETDRLAALKTELERLGGRVALHEDGLSLEPPPQIRPARIATYDDHRMAMSFSLAGLRAEGVVIEDPGCVSKTFPDFFDRWAGLAGHA